MYFKSYSELWLFKNSLPVEQPSSKAQDEGLNEGKLVQSAFLYTGLRVRGKKEDLVGSLPLLVMK